MELVIVGGFLGAGKTCLIRAWAQGAVNRGRRVLILENEVGEIGLDDLYLTGTGLEVDRVTGGCVCCELLPTMLTKLDQVMTTTRPDVILMEPSGAALVGDLAASLSRWAKTELKPRTVCVIDVVRFEMLLAGLAPLMNSQLAAAEIIVLSKVDLAAPEEIASVLTQLTESAPQAVIYQADLTGPQAGLIAALATEELTGSIPARLPETHGQPDNPPHQALSVYLTAPESGLGPEAAQRLIAGLTEAILDRDNPGHVKLLVRGADRNQALISSTGAGDLSLRGDWPDGRENMALTVINYRFDRQELDRMIKAETARSAPGTSVQQAVAPVGLL